MYIQNCKVGEIPRKKQIVLQYRLQISQVLMKYEDKVREARHPGRPPGQIFSSESDFESYSENSPLQKQRKVIQKPISYIR